MPGGAKRKYLRRWGGSWDDARGGSKGGRRRSINHARCAIYLCRGQVEELLLRIKVHLVAEPQG